MARAPFQVLVIPFDDTDSLQVAVLRRADMDAWQFVAGGGEENETPLQAALRESREEISAVDAAIYPLDTCCSVPASVIRPERRSHWPARTLVIPEYAFALRMRPEALNLSREHTQAVWLSPAKAAGLLRYDSNRTALEELTLRLARGWLGAAGNP